MAWIFEDDKGYFWMAGRDGMLRVARADLDAVAEGRKRAVKPRRFGVADGMRGRQRIRPGDNADGLARPGPQAVLCTYGGLLEIDPARLMTTRPARRC